VFNAGTLILDPLRRRLEAESESYRLRPPILTPSVGAAIYAAKLAAQPLSAAALRILQSHQVD
jgi:hypothetical protein